MLEAILIAPIIVIGAVWAFLTVWHIRKYRKK